MVVDLFLVYQFIRRLATPFEKWPAYKEGIIDKDGKVLIKSKNFGKKSQRAAWGIFDRMIANLKKLLAKVPGGSSKLASYAAALFLIKEYKAFTDESILNEDITDNQLDESMVLFSSRYNHYTTLAENVNRKKELNEAFGRARLRQNLAKGGMDVDKVHSQNVKDAEDAKKRRAAASSDLKSFRKKNNINTKPEVDEATNLANLKLINKIKKSGVVKSGSMAKDEKKPEVNEEPVNNVGGGNIAGMDGGHMSKAGQKKWTSGNKSSKKKRLRDIMGVPK